MTKQARADAFDWPPELIAEFNDAWGNGQVGHTLVSENDRVRVWHMTLQPGERVGFHHHVLNYFWTALTPGKSRSHMDDGSIVDANYEAGTTSHYEFGTGEFMMHDLKNIGDEPLSFVTVEHLNSPNTPHELGDHVPRFEG